MTSHSLLAALATVAEPRQHTEHSRAISFLRCAGLSWPREDARAVLHSATHAQWAWCLLMDRGCWAAKPVRSGRTHPIMVACQWNRSSGEVGPARAGSYGSHHAHMVAKAMPYTRQSSAVLTRCAQRTPPAKVQPLGVLARRSPALLKQRPDALTRRKATHKTRRTRLSEP